MATSVPNFELMVLQYLGDPMQAPAVKQMVGGSVNSPDIDDTCIVRISRSLNYTGRNIPPWTEAFRTRKGSDGRWYGLRVKEFWPYMVRKFGPAGVHSRTPKAEFNRFYGKKGIIGFKVPFADHSATGHFTLWNGKSLLYKGGNHDYFGEATEAGLWIAPSSVPFTDTWVTEPDV